VVEEKIPFSVKVLPLKFSKIFDQIFEKELSISQIMAQDALAAYVYREVGKQFDKILTFIILYGLAEIIHQILK